MPTYREIPETAIEIQTGLYLYTYERTIAGTTYLVRQLFASEGYCFYDSSRVYYDIEGNVITDEEVLRTTRIYCTWAGLATSANVDDYVSVPVEDEYTIASGGNNNHEIA